jgi:hypothetical protein
MAQTAAAGAGYRCRLQKIAPPIGFIASLKDLRIHMLPEIGSVIQTRCTVKEEIMGVTIVEATVQLDDDLLATCQMRIFLKKTN